VAVILNGRRLALGPPGHGAPRAGLEPAASCRLRPPGGSARAGASFSFERHILILRLPPGALPELSRRGCRDLESNQGLPVNVGACQPQPEPQLVLGT